MNCSIKTLLLLTVLLPLFTACGSRSSDFTTGVDVEHPLPLCPDSPNCVRITEVYPAPIDTAWNHTLSVLQEMKPYDLKLFPDEYRIDAVFLVVFFRDDMTAKLQQADSTSTYVHLRSSSRIGYNDFGVNRKRVKEFLSRIDPKK